MEITEKHKEEALETLRAYKEQSHHNIRDNIEYDCPSQDYEQGKPNGDCISDGHYMCEGCKHFCGIENLPGYLKPNWKS